MLPGGKTIKLKVKNDLPITKRRNVQNIDMIVLEVPKTEMGG